MKILVQKSVTICAFIALSICVNSCAGGNDTKTTKAESEATVQVASNSVSESNNQEANKAPIQLQFSGCKAHR